MVYPEPCKELERRPLSFMSGIFPCYPPIIQSLIVTHARCKPKNPNLEQKGTPGKCQHRETSLSQPEKGTLQNHTQIVNPENLSQDPQACPSLQMLRKSHISTLCSIWEVYFNLPLFQPNKGTSTCTTHFEECLQVAACCTASTS